MITLKKLSLSKVLIVVTPIIAVFLYIFRSSPNHKFQVLIITAIIYLTIGLCYHWRDKTLTLEIMIEYFLIAALALLVLGGLML